MDCDVTEILGRGGLKGFSLPFDWMFGYPCDVKNSLDKDFSDWLEPEYLEVLNHELGHFSTKHANYDSHTAQMRRSNNLTYAFFNHHTLLDESDRNLFKRRIERYRKIISSDEDVVFVTNSSIESFKEVGLDTQFKNRPNTYIVYLIKDGDNQDAAELILNNGNYVIRYQELSKHNNTISKLICDILINLSDNL